MQREIVSKHLVTLMAVFLPNSKTGHDTPVQHSLFVILFSFVGLSLSCHVHRITRCLSVSVFLKVGHNFCIICTIFLWRTKSGCDSHLGHTFYRQEYCIHYWSSGEWLDVTVMYTHNCS